MNDIRSRESPKDAPPSLATRIGSLLFLTGIFFLTFIARIIMAPLMPAIEQDLNISHGEAGSLFLLISIGYLPSLIGSGFISSRLTHRKTILMSSAILGFALLAVALCHKMWILQAALVLVGLSAGLYLPSGIATLTSLFRAADWGKAFAVHEFAPNLSFLAAPLICEVLLQWFSWRGILGLVGILAILLGAFFARFSKGGHFPGEALKVGAIKILFANRSFWIILVLFGLGVGGTLGIYTMLPLYLVLERGLEQSWANTLIALSRISGPAMSMLAGWSTDRLGARNTLCGVFFVTGLMTILLGMAGNAWLPIMVVLQPFLGVCFFPAGFAALSLIVPSKFRNVAVSLAGAFSVMFGGGLIPFLIGIAGDVHNFALGIVLVGSLVFMGGFLSPFVIYPNSGKDA